MGVSVDHTVGTVWNLVVRDGTKTRPVESAYIEVFRLSRDDELVLSGW